MMLSEKIQVALANCVLGVYYDWNGLADEMIEAGYDSPELYMMSLPSESNWDTIRNAFIECGFVFPDIKTSRLISLRYHLNSLYDNHGDMYALNDFRGVIGRIIDVDADEFNLGDGMKKLTMHLYYDEEIMYNRNNVMELVKHDCLDVIRRLPEMPNK